MRSIGDAFSFVFRDRDWPVKIFIGALFTFLSIFLIGIPVVYGYLIELLQRVRRNEPVPLPEWKDPGIKFITGFKYLVTLGVYTIPAALVVLSLVFLLFLTMPAFCCQSACSIASLTYLPLIICFVVLYSLALYLLLPFIAIRFAVRERIGDGLALPAIFRLFRTYAGESVLLLLLMIATSIGAAFGVLFFIVGVFATSFYGHCVIFHCYGQIAASIESSIPTTQQPA
jgi:hypothetical protein